MCHIPHQATMKIIPPICRFKGKILGLNSSSKPKPELCIPVSIVRVRRFEFETLKMDAIVKPVKSAKEL